MERVDALFFIGDTYVGAVLGQGPDHGATVFEQGNLLLRIAVCPAPQEVREGRMLGAIDGLLIELHNDDDAKFIGQILKDATLTCRADGGSDFRGPGVSGSTCRRRIIKSFIAANPPTTVPGFFYAAGRCSSQSEIEGLFLEHWLLARPKTYRPTSLVRFAISWS